MTDLSERAKAALENATSGPWDTDEGGEVHKHGTTLLAWPKWSDQMNEIIAALSEEGRKRGKAEAERDEAVALLRRWVAWCDGPALPHPLDDVDAAKVFLARLDADQPAPRDGVTEEGSTE